MTPDLARRHRLPGRVRGGAGAGLRRPPLRASTARSWTARAPPASRSVRACGRATSWSRDGVVRGVVVEGATAAAPARAARRAAGRGRGRPAQRGGPAARPPARAPRAAQVRGARLLVAASRASSDRGEMHVTRGGYCGIAPLGPDEANVTFVLDQREMQRGRRGPATASTGGRCARWPRIAERLDAAAPRWVRRAPSGRWPWRPAACPRRARCWSATRPASTTPSPARASPWPCAARSWPARSRIARCGRADGGPAASTTVAATRPRATSSASTACCSA